MIRTRFPLRHADLLGQGDMEMYASGWSPFLPSQDKGFRRGFLARSAKKFSSLGTPPLINGHTTEAELRFGFYFQGHGICRLRGPDLFADASGPWRFLNPFVLTLGSRGFFYMERVVFCTQKAELLERPQ